MLKKFLSIRLVALAIALFSGFATNAGFAQEKPDVEFQISSDKSTYLPGEPIFITSVVTSKSNKALTVKEPTALGFVSAFTIETTEAGKKLIFNHMVGAGVPGWQGGVTELQPGQSAKNECELSWQFGTDDFLLKPGNYLLRAGYCWSDYRAADYKTNKIEAKPIEFTVIQGTDKDKLNYEEFWGVWTNADKEQKKATLNQFLAKYPHSIHRVAALEKLVDIEWYDKNLAGTVEIYRRILKERISSSKREVIASSAADLLVQLGDIEGAIAILKDTTQPFNTYSRTQLEKKLKAK